MANITRELVNAPLHEIVKNLGIGIAEAQFALDSTSIEIAKRMIATEVDIGTETFNLLSLGFTPTFYQFVDTLIEVKMSFSMTKSREFGVSTEASAQIFVASASVSASYAQKYQYSAEGSSLMRTKLVSVPAPALLEQRLKALIDTA